MSAELRLENDIPISCNVSVARRKKSHAFVVAFGARVLSSARLEFCEREAKSCISVYSKLLHTICTATRRLFFVEIFFRLLFVRFSLVFCWRDENKMCATNFCCQKHAHKRIFNETLASALARIDALSKLDKAGPYCKPRERKLCD